MFWLDRSPQDIGRTAEADSHRQVSFLPISGFGNRESGPDFWGCLPSGLIMGRSPGECPASYAGLYQGAARGPGVRAMAMRWIGKSDDESTAVSYTHLTLPTIYSV